MPYSRPHDEKAACLLYYKNTAKLLSSINAINFMLAISSAEFDFSQPRDNFYDDIEMKDTQAAYHFFAKQPQLMYYVGRPHDVLYD